MTGLRNSLENAHGKPIGVKQGWPPLTIPEDICYIIATYLERKDICNTRLVNREFSLKFSRSHFRSVAVPFGPDFYVEDLGDAKTATIFDRIGHQIYRFGIIFEMDEAKYVMPPNKPSGIMRKTAFWGSYPWVDDTYIPYDCLHKIEYMAADTRKITTAFSRLVNLTEFAVCLNSGLSFWAPEYNRLGCLDFKEGPAVLRAKHPAYVNRYPYDREPVKARTRVAPRFRKIVPFSEADIVKSYPTLSKKSPKQILPFHPPCTVAQTDWLIETSWTIQAFLASLFCALDDNLTSLKYISTLTLAGISSGFLNQFDRSKFFSAFPRLKKITLMVIPDWLCVDKTSNPVSPITRVTPLDAVEIFRKVLVQQIAELPNLETLVLGYVGGGEYEVTRPARNAHILPAPLVLDPVSIAAGIKTELPLVFPHVKNLTFENCWFSPLFLCPFMEISSQTALEYLNFDSCSLVTTQSSREYALTYYECFPTVYPCNYYDQALRPNSWSDLINRFTPGLTLSEQRENAGGVKQTNLDDLRIDIPSLCHLKFISCGYAVVEADYNQNDLVNHPDDQGHFLLRRVTAHQPYVGLGAIVPLVAEDEHLVLQRGFGMTIGLDRIVPQKDSTGNPSYPNGGVPGPGRFSGSIFRPENPRPTSH